MFIDLQEIQSFGSNQFQLITATTAATANGLQALSAEAGEFSKKRVETNYALGQRLLKARSLDEIIELQSDFARASLNDFITETTRIGVLYSDLAKEVFKSAKAAPVGKSSAASSSLNGAIVAKQPSTQN